jgi:sulfide:quinone oxidoreductase
MTARKPLTGASLPHRLDPLRRNTEAIGRFLRMARTTVGGSLSSMAERDRRVTIVGGGVASLEALLALQSLAGERLSTELIAAAPQFAYRPLAVAEPFGLGTAHRFDLTEIARDQGATLHVATVTAVDPGERSLTTSDGRSLDYDMLLLAVGARSTVAVPGSVSIQGPTYTSRFRTVLRELDERRITRVAFAVPTASTWALPLYELALLTGAHVAERGLRKVELHLVTHEPEPLAIFGKAASAAVAELLEERGVRFHPDRAPVEASRGELMLAPGPPLAVDRVVSLPHLVGPAIDGLPGDGEGFIPVDLHGRVQGLDDVWAAGDATSVPIKQGGVASQQADAAAESIAAAAGAAVKPTPFRPVLRGLLLTGGAPRYLRAEVSGGRGEDWGVSDHALWWPPSKVAGRYLAPYLATHRHELETPPSGIDVEVDLHAPAVRRRAIIHPDGAGRARAVHLGDKQR